MRNELHKVHKPKKAGGRILTALLATVIASSTFAAPPQRRLPAKPAQPVQPIPDADGITNNPLLPPPITLDALNPDLTLVQKAPAATTPPTAPPGFAPFCSAEDWATYREKFGTEADGLTRLKSSGIAAFAKKLLTAGEEPNTPKSLARLLLLRAAIDSYRNKEGYTVADAAVKKYERLMDLDSPAQIAALWTIANAMSRSIATPRLDRIRYSAIAAQANMQLTLILLNADQVAAAESLTHSVNYHEGWLRSRTATDPAGNAIIRQQITQVRNLVKQTVSTMKYLQTQYQPAINGDDGALMAIYLYGRYVKQKPGIVADLPNRKPASPLAQLAKAINAATHDPMANYTTAETLRLTPSTLPDGVLKSRTLYASLNYYRAFIDSAATEKERVKRTLARMAMESVISDGAHGPIASVHPFAKLEEPATQPTTAPSLVITNAPTTKPVLTTIPYSNAAHPAG